MAEWSGAVEDLGINQPWESSHRNLQHGKVIGGKILKATSCDYCANYVYDEESESGELYVIRPKQKPKSIAENATWTYPVWSADKKRTNYLW